jgi:signal transduction histidine kinase/CheY-like chemotaxis protein
MKNLNRRIHVFIKRRLPRHLRSTRNIFFVSFTGCAFVGLLCIAVWLYGMGQNASATSGLVTAVVVALSIVVWRVTGNTLYGGLVYQPALMAVVLFNAAITGGVTSPALTWLAIIPLLPLFTSTRLWAMVWIGLSFLGVIVLYQLQTHGLIPNESATALAAPGGAPWQSLAFGAGMFSLMLLAQIVLVQTFDTANEQHLRRLQQSNHRLEVLSRNLQVANAHKDQFLAMVSHEMRTPLNAVMGYLGLLTLDKELSSSSAQHAQGAKDSAAHLVTVINDLLDFSQIQQGKLVLSLKAVHLRELLTRSHHTLSPRARQQGLDYRLMLDPNLPDWVMADPHRLTQILLNLLGNALKFTTAGHVQLHAAFELSAVKPSHGVLTLSVQDTGRGIPASALKDIFKPFVQLEASDNHLREGNALHGNGLGLAITRSLVQSHKGTLSVTSVLGQGSTFRVQLPIDVTAAPIAQSGAELSTYPAALKLLVVDDHVTNRTVARATLTRGLPNATIDQAANGTEALEKMRQQRYDLVLMDLVMPDLSGIEVVQRIRQEAPPPLCDVPVVALTANLAQEVVQACLSVGFKEVLPKPFDREVLLQAILHHARPAALG